ncbi:glycoside hydrolase [Thozetella sp. PMI_491]|nr:glycoside hydrolase [Thozetella sp. PMI_491]
MRFTNCSLAFVSIVGLAAAKPAGRDVHAAHAPAHKKPSPKPTGTRVHHILKDSHKGILTFTDPTVTKPTKAPEIVVFTDKKGNPVRTTTEVVWVVPPHPTGLWNGTHSNGTNSSSSSSIQVPPTPSPFIPPTVLPVAAPETAAPGTPEAAASPAIIETAAAPPPNPSPAGDVKAPTTGFSGAAGLTGVTYSPYAADGSCKSSGQVLSDMKRLEGLHGAVRIYGVDCNQVDSVMQAANSIGVKVMLGIFDVDAMDDGINQMTSAVKANGGWGPVAAVSIGNELVNNGQASADQMIQAVNSARQSLRAAGYNGPVVTVDTFVAMQKYPALCDNSDFCAMNIHPFFDPNTDASGAGEFVANQVERTRQLLSDPNQRIVVTESGWPTQGSANGAAVPGQENQQVALQSLMDNYGSQNPENLFMFTAFNDLWKKADPGTFYAEQFWGMTEVDTNKRRAAL